MKYIFSNTEFKQLLNAQNELNIKYQGENWVDKTEISHINSAIFTEMAEYLESIPRIGDTSTGWKWWKPNDKNDIQNAKVEVVDILHFALSYLISEFTIEELIEEHMQLSNDNFDNIFNELDELYITNIHNSYYWFSLQIDYICERLNIFYRFINTLMIPIGMTIEELYDGYIQKNNINHNRVDNGYMKGTYQKVDLNGNEDNRKIKFKNDNI